MAKALYIESVHDAAAIAGGKERLAAVLGVSAGEVERWSTGASIPECSVFLRLIEVLLGPDLPAGPAAEEPAPGPQVEPGGFTGAQAA
jgi:hypothetical protein